MLLLNSQVNSVVVSSGFVVVSFSKMYVGGFDVLVKLLDGFFKQNLLEYRFVGSAVGELVAVGSEVACSNVAVATGSGLSATCSLPQAIMEIAKTATTMRIKRSSLKSTLFCFIPVLSVLQLTKK